MIGNPGTFPTECLVMIAKATLLKKTLYKGVAVLFPNLRLAVLMVAFPHRLCLGGNDEQPSVLRLWGG